MLYYNLPELEASEVLTLEVADASGKLIRSFSSVGDSTFSEWEGGPSEEPTLSKKKDLIDLCGTCAFLRSKEWLAFISKAILMVTKHLPANILYPEKGNQSMVTAARILPNPLYATSPKDYMEYDELMTKMETEASKMHQMVNDLNDQRIRLESVLQSLPADSKYDDLRKEGNETIKK